MKTRFLDLDFIDLDRNVRYSHGRERLDENPTPGEVFRRLRAEYGRCTGAVYVDGPDGKARRVGWVFVSKQRYDDSPEFYLREVWACIVEVQHSERFASLEDTRSLA